MTKFLLILLLSALSLQAQDSNRIIIKLNDKHSAALADIRQGLTGVEAIDIVSRREGITGIRRLHSGKKSKAVLYVLSFPPSVDTKAIIEAYKATGAVEYAEPDYTGAAGGKRFMQPDDTHYNKQWGLNNDGSFNMYPATAGADIQMEDAWNIEQGSEDVVVAVMDSGIRMGHPEFEGRIWTNTGEIAGNNIDDDNNGLTDDLYGWDFANDDNDPSDDHGHGTNVTGIIGAKGDNGTGYSGVDLNCRLMPLKGLDGNNNGLYSWWHDAIIYAADNGADVINLSVGGSQFSAALKDAIDYALENNVVVVACMMNTDNSISYYPARFEGVIAVGSTNPDDVRSSPFFWDTMSGSNYGSHISVVAPGNFIYGLSHTSDTDYDVYWGGTSQATPLVSGLAALLRAQEPSRTPAQIKTLIEATAEDQVGNPAEDTPGFDIFYGHGRINAFSALTTTMGTQQPEAVEPFVIYPNPSAGAFTLEAKDYPAKISVYNTLGQIVLQKSISNDSMFEIAAPGVYIVSVSSGKYTASQKVVVK